jgi:hypothetical protein
MTYTPIENRLGIQPIAVANVPAQASANLQTGQSPYFGKAHALGTIVRADDPIFGEGEFIYLQMAATQVIGSMVTWGGFGTVVGDGTNSEAQYQASLSTTGANQDRLVGFAMSAFPTGAPATAFGWFQIGGHAVALTNGSNIGAVPGPVFQDSATAGVVGTTGTQAGRQVLRATAILQRGAAPLSGNLALLEIDRPLLQGQIV